MPHAQPTPSPVQMMPRSQTHASRGLPLRVGTRGSPLARVQTRAFVGLLAVARLRRWHIATDYLPIDPEAMVPSAGQGIVGVTVRAVSLAERSIQGAPIDSERLGTALGNELRADCPSDIFA